MSVADLLADHGRHPRNMGRLGDADAVGNVGSIVVGRALRFFIKLEGERIKQAKFQVFACPDMVATASLLTELVVDRSLDAAAALTVDDLAVAAGVDRHELPFHSWGLAALGDALAQQRGAKRELAKRPAGTQVCRCHGIDEEAIRAAIADGAASLDAIEAATGAGGACGSCRAEVDSLLSGPAPQASARPAAPSISGRIGQMKRIEQALAELVAGEEQAGGRVELWDFRPPTLLVRLGGRLAEDGPDRRGAIERIDRCLKDEVDGQLGVEIVADR